jgi:ADP-ribosylglycohydrolase
MLTHQDRLTRAQLSLQGLSVADAFGELFFRRRAQLQRFWAEGGFDRQHLREYCISLGQPPWPWTDDTAMAISIVRTLDANQGIDPDDLARRFADAYRADPRRGYGPAMHRLLPELRYEAAWHVAPHQLFHGQGSFGNGAAMRVAPVGAYNADEMDAVVEQARRSAVVTHAHPEAIAGAIAVATAAALAWRARQQQAINPQAFLRQVHAVVPPSEVTKGIQRAIELSATSDVQHAVQMLGNGSHVTAQDTVPFVLWCAAHFLDNYEEALWHTVSGLGDMDTTCAIVGGIVVMFTGVDSIPSDWRRHREPLPM